MSLFAMTGLVSAASLLLFVVLAALGTPTSALLRRTFALSPPKTALGELVLLFLLGSSTVTVAAAFVTPWADGPWVTIAGVGGLWITEVVVLGVMVHRQPRRKNPAIELWLNLLPQNTYTRRDGLWTAFVFLITGVSAQPGIASWGQATFSTTTGPDGVGYAVASQSIGAGVSPDAVGEQIQSNFATVPVDVIISTLSGGVHDLASMTAQIRGEFLVGADRLGLATLEGMLLGIFGLSAIWLLHLIICSMSLAACAFAGTFAFKGRKNELPRVGILALLLATNQFILYAWHQGGVGQVFTMPLLLALLLAASGKLGMWTAPATAVATAGLMVSYQDAAVVAAAICGLSLLLQFLGLAEFQSRWRQFLTGFGIGMILVLPLVPDFGRFLVARGSDAGISGWSVPYAASPVDLLGLVPAGSQALNWFDAAGVLRIASMITLGALLLAAVFARYRRPDSRELSGMTGTAIAVIIFLALVYAKTLLVDDATNYQFFKAVTMCLPFLLMYLVSIAPSSLAAESRDPLKVARSLVWSVACVTLVAVITWNGFQWIRDWRSSAWYMPESFVSASYTPMTKAAFEKHDFVTSDPWAVSYATLGDFHWINRDPYLRLPLDYSGREIALLARRDSVGLKDRGVDPPATYLADGDLLYFGLGASSTGLRGQSYREICVAAGILWAAQGRTPLDGCNPQVPATDFVALDTNGAIDESPIGAPCETRILTNDWSGRILIKGLFPQDSTQFFETAKGEEGFNLSVDSVGRVVATYPFLGDGEVVGFLRPGVWNVLSLKFDATGRTVSVNGVPKKLTLTPDVLCEEFRLVAPLSSASDWEPAAPTVAGVLDNRSIEAGAS